MRYLVNNSTLGNRFKWLVNVYTKRQKKYVDIYFNLSLSPQN